MMKILWVALIGLWFVNTLPIGTLNVEMEREVIRQRTSQEIRQIAVELFDSGRHSDMLLYLDVIESVFGNLAVDGTTPSLYSYRGVALAGHSGSNSKGAVEAFKNATLFYPNDIKSWVNLGEASMYVYEMKLAETAFLQAQVLGSLDVLARLVSVKAWSLSWRQFESLTAILEHRVYNCFDVSPRVARWDTPFRVNHACLVDNTQGFEYTDTSAVSRAYFYSLSPNSRTAKIVVPDELKAALWTTKGWSERRLKIGVLSSDFGIHPVASLIRGFVQYINSSRIELFCFSVSPQISWWSGNISRIVEKGHYIGLDGMNAEDAARIIASFGIEVLIDLNGHTIKSGLPIMSFKPAPVQVTFLGWPTTTAAPYIDYYLGDWITNPIEHSAGYYEKQLLLPPCYISNDHAQMQGNLLYLTGSNRAPRSALESKAYLDDATVLFSTFSNAVKWDPVMFAVWMQILQRCPGSKLLVLNYEEMKFGFPALYSSYAPYFGVSPSRLALGNVIPWVDHLYAKTAVDLNLDTASKNGHTTGLDAAWAGVPTIALAGGVHGPTRSAESIASALQSNFGLSYSFKDYEDVVSLLTDDLWSRNIDENKRKYESDQQDARRKVFASTLVRKEFHQRLPWRLRLLRDFVEQQRFKSSLFDAPGWANNFEHLMAATWELEHLKKNKKFHVFASAPQDVRMQRRISAYHTVDTAIGNRPWFPSKRVIEQFQHRFGFDVIGPLPSASTSETEKSVPEETAESVNKYHLPRLCKDIVIYPVDPTSLLTDLTLLHIGSVPEQARGQQTDWISISSVRNPGQVIGYENGASVQVVRYMHDMQGFPDKSITAIYASHVLEHNSFGDGMLETAIKEMKRILRPGGVLLLSVPDLEIIAKFLLDQSVPLASKQVLVHMIYGGQQDEFDYHSVGFTLDILTDLLISQGFCNVDRVGEFNLFRDTSTTLFMGRHISLNVVARPCLDELDVANELLFVAEGIGEYEESIW